MKTQVGQFVQVDWNDASSSNTLVWDKKRDHRPAVMSTRGWVLESDKVGITIANEFWIEDGVKHWRGWTMVPRGMVVTIKPIHKTTTSGHAKSKQWR